jgi:hypothetical protein
VRRVESQSQSSSPGPWVQNVHPIRQTNEFDSCSPASRLQVGRQDYICVEKTAVPSLPPVRKACIWQTTASGRNNWQIAKVVFDNWHDSSRSKPLPSSSTLDGDQIEKKRYNRRTRAPHSIVCNLPLVIEATDMGDTYPAFLLANFAGKRCSQSLTGNSKAGNGWLRWQRSSHWSLQGKTVGSKGSVL